MGNYTSKSEEHTNSHTVIEYSRMQTSPSGPFQGSTFKFADVEIKKREYKPVVFSEIVKRNTKVCKPNETIHISTDTTDSISTAFNHGLLGAIYMAYSYHTPLIIRPDDIWLSIMLAFGKYVVGNAASMRNYFVQHEGKKELHLLFPLAPPLGSTTESHWNGFLLEMEKAIRANTIGSKDSSKDPSKDPFQDSSNIADWMTPDFSTTTQLDKTVSILVLMGAMKEYFLYKFELGCGLTEVTLQGTLDDWIALKERVNGLLRFKTETNLIKWHEILVPVLDQFIRAYQGDVDGKFWQSICTPVQRGSGGQKNFRGWFLVFCPFNGDNKYILDDFIEIRRTGCYGNVADDDIPAGTIDMPIVIIDNETEHPAKLMAGCALAKYDSVKNTLQSQSSWALIISKPVTREDLLELLNKIQMKQLEKLYDNVYYSRSLRKTNPDGKDQYIQEEKVKRLLSHENKWTKTLQLVDFVLFFARVSYFPNDSLYELITNIERFMNCITQDYNPEKLEGGKLYKAFINSLVPSQVKHYLYQNKTFVNWIDVAKIDKIIQRYESTDPELNQKLDSEIENKYFKVIIT